MSTAGRRRMAIAALGMAMMLALTPVPLRSQDSAMDAWRKAFSENLDETIAGLREEAQRGRIPAVVVTWGRAPEAERQPTFPPLPGGAVQLERFPTLASILSEKGLPPSLMGVAAVESGLDPLALSPKGARGLWQLMSETARRYGLVVEPDRDDRTDPVKSTFAAAAYIKDLHTQFRDWPLALAAYNAGGDRVTRAMNRVGARDFWTLLRQRALPDETLRYVPAVLTKLPVPALQMPAISPARAKTAFSELQPPKPVRVLYAESAVKSR